MPNRALIVIDVQQEYFDGPLAIQYPPVEQSLARITRVLDATQSRLPVVMVRHESPDGAPVFAAGSRGWELHPGIEERRDPSWLSITKRLASAFPGTGLAEQLREQGADTVTVVGYMTNNCVLATAADAQQRGFTVEVLSDATGSIHLANEAGSTSAKQVQETLMTLLQSNFATVATTHDWLRAVEQDEDLPGSNLVASALQGAITNPFPTSTTTTSDQQLM